MAYAMKQLICRRSDENFIHAEKTTGQYATNQIYYLRLEVCGGEQRAQVILFEAAKYLPGCNVQDYIESTSVCFERKHANHAAEKTGALKWLMQWDMVDL
ncbi:hypothetical protein H5410_064308 [Solanum commersonii]|uniref:Uncharacterized protein n=1 Tax=Solanum commersonii TaxID=4109 RepID=A0A9J5VZV5_SOLCO|nr:hypothetical protein H5410_064308 [Solanum commersonii]